MARSRWIFGNQQNHPARDPAQPIPLPVVPSADAKKFGLENFGNTCYANSVIQALYFCTPFRDLLIQSPDSRAPRSSAEQLGLGSVPPQPLASLVPVRRPPERQSSISGSFGESSAKVQPTSIPPSPPTLFSALRSLFLHISTHPLDKGTVAPSAFIEQLRRANDMFRSPMHQDAHEFLNYLLNKIVEEIEEDRKSLQSGSADELTNSVATLASGVTPTITTSTSAHSSGSQDVTLVHKLFEGTLTSETRCLTCETVSARDESFLDLSLDIEQNSSVTACLRQFSASEMLCQKNKFFCDACCDLQEAEKRMKIKKLPNILALHLKRFKIQEDPQNRQKYIKLGYRVAFPFQLRLFNTVDDAADADRLYNLFAIVVHIGNGPHHGHYISIIKTLGTWLVFDDDNVYPITESEIPKYYGESNSGAAYVLYYEAEDIDLPALGLRTPPPPTMSAASVLHSETEPASPPHSANPTLPPGLTEEGDTSDLSDSAYHVTPSQSSLPLPTGEKPPRPALEVNVSNLNDTSIQSTSSIANATPSSPAVNGRGNKGLFSTIRRTPSAKLNLAGIDTRRAANERSTTTPISDDANGKIPPNRTPSPTPPSTSQSQPEKKEPERKTSNWFSKRKSLRVAEKKDNDYPPSPVVPVLSKTDQTSTSQSTSSSSSANASSAQIKSHSNPPRDIKGRRPIEPVMFDVGAFAPIPPMRSRPTAERLTVKPQKDRRSQTYEALPESAPPASFSSSAPGPASAMQPPPRKSSLSTDSHRSPEHKKSLSHLSRKDKRRSAPSDNPPRPATAGGTTAETISTSRHLPPVPSLPSNVVPDMVNGHANLDKGKLRDDRPQSPIPRPMSAGAVPVAPSLASTAGTNLSAASTPSGNATLNLKRATRKLSMSGQMFGFGKRDKEKKEKEREEKESGKGPPSSYNHY